MVSQACGSLLLYPEKASQGCGGIKKRLCQSRLSPSEGWFWGKVGVEQRTRKAAHPSPCPPCPSPSAGSPNCSYYPPASGTSGGPILRTSRLGLHLHHRGGGRPRPPHWQGPRTPQTRNPSSISSCPSPAYCLSLQSGLHLEQPVISQPSLPGHALGTAPLQLQFLDYSHSLTVNMM